MAIKKVEGESRQLPVTSLLNAFSVMQDEDRIRFVNIFRSYTLSDDTKNNSRIFEYYQVEGDEFLDDISSKLYGSPNLWWVIAVFNDIENPFEGIEEGQTLKVLSGAILYSVFDDIRTIGEL